MKKMAIICDMDGTLALLNNRNPLDASTSEQDILNDPIANIIEVYAHQTLFPIDLIIITGRDERFRSQSEAWLRRHTITHYKALYMRKEGDRTRDDILKRQFYEKHVKAEYDVLFVLEDRDRVVKMWREELGITCLQVDYGDF